MNSQPELEKSVRISIRIPTAAAINPPATGRMNVSRFLHTGHHSLFNFASQDLGKKKGAAIVPGFQQRGKLKMRQICGGCIAAVRRLTAETESRTFLRKA